MHRTQDEMVVRTAWMKDLMVNICANIPWLSGERQPALRVYHASTIDLGPTYIRRLIRLAMRTKQCQMFSCC